MKKPQVSAVESESSREFFGLLLTIKEISPDRTAQSGQMHPNLMGSSRVQPQPDQRFPVRTEAAFSFRMGRLMTPS